MSAPAPGNGTLEARILALLAGVAPDVDPPTVRADRDFRDQFDFDSMDMFNFAAAIHAEFGIDIPERDYRELGSVARCAAYLRSRGQGSAAGKSS